MENKSNKGLKVTVVLLIIIILGLCGYIYYDKFVKKEKVKIKEVVKEEKKESDFVLLTDNCIDTINHPRTCQTDFEAKINSKDLKVTAKKKDINIEYDDKLIYTFKNVAKDFGAIHKIYAKDDIILIFYYEGTDVRGTKLVAINLEGEELFNDKKLDSKYPEMFIFDGVNYSYIEDGKLFIEGTRLTHGPSIAYEDGDLEKGYICKMDKNSTEVVEGLYEIKYSNNEVKVNNVEYTDLKTYLEKNPNSCKESE